jgi:hypothetical protein
MPGLGQTLPVGRCRCPPFSRFAAQKKISSAESGPHKRCLRWSNGRDPQYGGHTRIDYCRFGFRGNRTRSRLLAVAREGRSKCSRNEGQPDGLMLSVFHGENTLPLKNPKRSMGTSLCVGTKKVVDAFNSLPAFTHGSYAPFGGTGSHITSSEDAR